MPRQFLPGHFILKQRFYKNLLVVLEGLNDDGKMKQIEKIVE
jgi:hypothetical protein